MLLQRQTVRLSGGFGEFYCGVVDLQILPYEWFKDEVGEKHKPGYQIDG